MKAEYKVRQHWANVLAIIIAFALSLSIAIGSPEYRAVTILHTNDTHGHLLPFSYPEPRSQNEPVAALQFRTNIGGIARRATLANEIRQETRGNTFLIDAGDALDGTPFSVEYMGEADFAAMRAAGYQLRTNGNHEFSASLKKFHQNIETGGFPVIDANVIDKNTNELALPAYIIEDINGVKIAFFGLTTTDASSYKAAKEGFNIISPIETARKLVPELQKQADIIIAITHIGYNQDVELAKEVNGIDVIVGAHSHTRLAKPVLVDKPKDDDPFNVDGTVIVQDFQWGGELGRLNLRFRRDGQKFRLMSYDGGLIPITSAIPDDPATKKTVDKYYKPMEKYYDEIIGEASETFYNDEPNKNAILNLICDAMKYKTGADGAIYNTGGVRADIVKGPIKMWDIATVMPFQNNLMLVEISGARLKQALLELKPGVSANMRYKIEANNLIDAQIDGNPINDSATYRIATIDFLANYGLKDVQSKKDLGINYREAIKDYIKSKGTISPVLDGRRLVISSSAAPI